MAGGRSPCHEFLIKTKEKPRGADCGGVYPEEWPDQRTSSYYT